MKDPYAVLGLSRDTDPETLKAKYKELHDLYGEQRFKSGEEGNEGARKLQELEEAWVLISANIEKDTKTEAFGGDYSKVDELIRDGKYNEAQDILDSITERKGEWHYMQAIVFYKREWLSEAKTQLEMAIQDDPSNSKYKESLAKLKMAIDNPAQIQNRPQQDQSTNYGGAPNYGGSTPPPQQDNMSNCLSTCCCAYCLTDCLCSAMRCC